MAKITLKNIKAFTVGNFNFYRDKLNLYPQYKKEQVLYRLEQCKNDCVITGKCMHCGCPTQRKVFAPESCNKGERFPDIMEEMDWNKFKTKHNLNGIFGEK